MLLLHCVLKRISTRLRDFQAFRRITRDAHIETVRAGRPVSVEGETPLDGGDLRVLLSGKIAVRCDDIFLHFVQPFEFVNSVEWRSMQLDRPAEHYQVR